MKASIPIRGNFAVVNFIASVGLAHVKMTFPRQHADDVISCVIAGCLQRSKTQN